MGAGGYGRAPNQGEYRRNQSAMRFDPVPRVPRANIGYNPDLTLSEVLKRNNGGNYDTDPARVMRPSIDSRNNPWTRPRWENEFQTRRSNEKMQDA